MNADNQPGLMRSYMSTQQAADSLGYTVQHTRLLIRQGELQASKFGRDWLVVRESVAEYQLQIGFPKTQEIQVREVQGIVNVASVPLRSPFRYAGGKTWLVPRVRQWLRSKQEPFAELVEPFAGGAIVGLTAVFDNLVKRATLAEIDEDVGAVWQTILNGRGKWLAEEIASFELSGENIRRVLEKAHQSTEQRAFATIVRNRITRGGILASGAGVVKRGENGKGLSSRWYPATLRRRILNIVALRARLRFLLRDGIQVLKERARRENIAFFIDPPYTVAGKRLYTHSQIDHEELFRVTTRLAGDFLITYDDADEIRRLAAKHGLVMARVPMKSTHHEKKMELLIGRDLSWLRE